MTGEEQQNPQCHEYNPRRKDDHCKYTGCGEGPEARPHLLWDAKHQPEEEQDLYEV